jgi:hypothetical protein
LRGRSENTADSEFPREMIDFSAQRFVGGMRAVSASHPLWKFKVRQVLPRGSLHYQICPERREDCRNFQHLVVNVAAMNSDH